MPLLSTFGAASARSKGRGHGTTTISTALGFPSPTSQGSREYYFASRKMTLFYGDMYGETTHIILGSAAASYSDARHIANDDGHGDSSTTCLVNLAGNYVGYRFDSAVVMRGCRAYGTYAGVLLSEQGILTVETWNGASWIVQTTIASGNSSLNSSPGLSRDFSTPVLARGIRIKHASGGDYCPYSFFAAIDMNGSPILGVG
jgi:hypothetical protein